jgi:hypothetical protein
MLQMKPIWITILSISLLLSGIGCKGGESAVVGKWKGEIKVAGSKDDPGAKFAEALGSMMSMDLELKSDHTFAMTMMMLPIGGDWSMSDNSVTLTPKIFMGMTKEEFEKKEKEKGGTFTKSADADKPIVLELQPDGTMVGQDQNSAKGPDSSKLVFTKKS